MIAALQDIERRIGRLEGHCDGCSRQSCGIAAALFAETGLDGAERVSAVEAARLRPYA